ncbi:sulfurtransferase-like selenium metabolism protein YedF [Chloroflexota bacterium]
MITTVDARGLACPQPVILTRKAMQQGDRLATLVDNDAAMTNVSRMAVKAGWRVNVVREGDEYRVELVKEDSTPYDEPARLAKSEASSGPLVLVVPADTMGRGEAELGTILVRSFFHTLGEIGPVPRTIVFLNSGVRLACEGSQVLDDLCALEAEGVEMLVCGTCLGYFELKGRLAAGQVSNMYEIAETILGAGNVVNL